jgi:AraC family transcriptional regulator, transcriptional activator of pobA
MKFKFEDTGTQGILSISLHDPQLKGQGFLRPQQDTINTFVLNKENPQQVTIDGIAYTFPSNTLLPLVANQHFVFERPDELVAWQFNREFYCIVEHDAEVGCVGFLFYGIDHPLFVSLSVEEMNSLRIIEQLFIEDITLDDFMQGELLRTMLKRLIIKITRIARKQTENYEKHTDDKMDMIRKFNLLVECNFRQQHDVQYYAKAMNKSPKTLSNIFSLCNYPAPSKVIQKRIILEAMRYIQYTEKSAKEIAYELGFATPAHFSRFFKKNTGNKFSVWQSPRKKSLVS